MTLRSIVLIALLILQWLAGRWALKGLSRELERTDHSKWAQMGDPLKYSAYSIPRELRWNKFVLLREYRKFDDKRMSSFGDLLFVFQFTAIALIVALMVPAA